MDKLSFTSKSRVLVCGVILALGASACPTRGTNLAQFYQRTGEYAKVDFATLNAEVLAPKCLSCHKEYATEAGVLADVKAGDLQGSSLYTEILNRTMPPSGPPVSNEGLKIVEQYILGLNTPAPGPSTVPSPIPVPSVITYEFLKQNALDSKCMKCHEDDLGAEADALQYVVKGSPETSSLYKVVIEGGSMPPKGTRLTPDEIMLIKTYISGLATE